MTAAAATVCGTSCVGLGKRNMGVWHVRAAVMG